MTLAANDQPDLTKLADMHLCDALAAIAGLLGPMAKTQSGAGVPYKYLGIDQLQEKLTPMFAAARIVIRQEDVDLWADETYTVGQGTTMRRVVYKVTWAIHKGDKGAWNAVTIGEAADNSDKASNKAQTAALKALYLHLFAVATPQDDQDSSRPDGPHKSGQSGSTGGSDRSQGGASSKAVYKATKMLEEANNDGYLGQALDAAVALGLDEFIADKVKEQGPGYLESLAPKAVSFLIDGATEAKGQQ